MTDPSAWQSATVQANGLNFHYNRTGNGSQPPLVLAHGFSDNGLCWTPLAEALSADYDVIMVDARNHGLSDAPDQIFTLLDQVEDLVAFVKALNLDKPILLGHSMGAITALLLAAKYPSLPKAILLEDPPPLWAFDPLSLFDASWAAKTHQWLDKIKTQTRAEIIAEEWAKSPRWSEAEMGPWADSKMQFHLNGLDKVKPVAVDLPTLLPQVTCPVLLITADPVLLSAVTAEQAKALQGLVPQTQVAHIANSGHSIRRDQFDAYLAAVRSFLAEAAPQP